MKPSARDVKALQELTGCGMIDAKRALEAREGILEYAIEYVQRAGLAMNCSAEHRFPKWNAYLKSPANPKETK